MEGEPAYLYGRGNPVNRVDPSGLSPAASSSASAYNIRPSGYLEGRVVSLGILHCSVFFYGEEVVYNFHTGERARFAYFVDPEAPRPLSIPLTGISGFRTDGNSVDVAVYAGFLWGFKRNFEGT